MQGVIALGNPGKKYEKTRHNVGWMVIDAVVGKTAKWDMNKKFNALVLRQDDVLFVKPLTFMKASGEAVDRVLKMYSLRPADLLLVHDDSDMLLGRMKLAAGGSSGGHRGMQSVFDHLHTQEFVRLKVGVRPIQTQGRSDTCVTKQFSFGERGV